jgi:hypothetical protein
VPLPMLLDPDEPIILSSNYGVHRSAARRYSVAISVCIHHEVAKSLLFLFQHQPIDRSHSRISSLSPSAEASGGSEGR